MTPEQADYATVFLDIMTQNVFWWGFAPGMLWGAALVAFGSVTTGPRRLLTNLALIAPVVVILLFTARPE